MGKTKWCANECTVNWNGVFCLEMFSGEILLRNMIFAYHWHQEIQQNLKRPKKCFKWLYLKARQGKKMDFHNLCTKFKSSIALKIRAIPFFWPSNYLKIWYLFSWHIWCLSSPVSCKNHICEQHFTTHHLRTKYPRFDSLRSISNIHQWDNFFYAAG